MGGTFGTDCEVPRLLPGSRIERHYTPGITLAHLPSSQMWQPCRCRTALPGEIVARNFKEVSASRHALTGCELPMHSSTIPISHAGSLVVGLTPRQIEVLRLVVLGRTDRQIAQELVVSEKTVGRHLENIFGRLGVSSRAAAAVVVVRHGLL